MALFFEINIAFSVFIISAVLAILLLQLQKKTKLPNDALLGLLAHASLAVGLVVIGFLTSIRFDVMALLFGDILAVNQNDLLVIWIGGGLILIILRLIWKPLFASTVNYELSEAELIFNDVNKPTKTDTNPNITEKITICLGLLEIFLAVAAGIISIPVIKSSPTILIEMAIRAAVKIVKIALNLSGFMPSASDNS